MAHTLRKRPAVVGTTNDDAFQLAIGASAFPDVFPLGFGCHPHVGVYGHEFSVALPSVTLAMGGGPHVREEVGLLLPAAARPVTEHLETFFILHGAVAPARCQKFTCDNDDEFNVLFHMWCFPRAPVLEKPDLVATDTVDVSGHLLAGVQCVHLDVRDGGIPAGNGEPRTVTIHGGCFSPENCMLQFSPDSVARPIVAFATLARSPASAPDTGPGRAVFTFHVLPRTEDAALALAELVKRAETLADLESLVRGLASHPLAAAGVDAVCEAVLRAVRAAQHDGSGTGR